LECAAAPENSLPRPARSASNQEVRQGSCEWRQPFVGCREASSSLVARSKKNTPSDRMGYSFWNNAPRDEARKGTSAARKTCRGHVLVPVCVSRRGSAASEPRRPLQKHHPTGGVFFVCASALTVVSAGCRRLPQPTAGTLPRKRLASSAAGGASALSSSPAPKTPPYRWCFFFVCASALTVVSAGWRRLPQPTAGTLPRKRLASSAAGGASALSSSPAPKTPPYRVVFFFRVRSALTVVSAGWRPRFSAYCAIFRVVMTRKWGRRTRFRQNNRYFAFFFAMEKSMWYTSAEYNSECAGGLHRCGLGAPLLRAVAGNVCTHDRDPVHRRRRDIAAPHGGLTEPGRRP